VFIICGWLALMSLASVVSAQTAAKADKATDDFKALVKAMAAHVRQLEANLPAESKPTAATKARIAETKELARLMDEFPASLARRFEAFRVRKQYSGIDASWHHLVAALRNSKELPEPIEQTLRAAAETDLAIHRATRSREASVYYGMNAPMEGMNELRRLGFALVDRAQALAETIRVEVSSAQGGRLLEEAVNLSQAAENYREALKADGRVDAITQNGFAPIEAMSKAFYKDISAVASAPRSMAAWKSYASVEVLMRQVLNGPAPAAAVAAQPVTEENLMQSILDLGDQLILEASKYADLFGPTGNGIDEGAEFLNDAQLLQIAAANFHREAATTAAPATLAFKFRDVDIIWLRLARRTARIGRAQAGFNRYRVDRMGQIIGELHRLLGIPGYPASFAGYS
jgi:hypothetical protein